MTEKDKEWLEKCKAHPEKYEILVDNDCISVQEVNPHEKGTEEWYEFIGDEDYTFSECGEYFIISLLNCIGIKADHC